MIKDDEELKARVLAELARDPSLAGAGIGVIVQDGVVTITGHVDTLAQKEAVERAIRYIDDVCATAFELDARNEFGHKPSDTEIAHAAITALRAHPQLSADHVRVEVENGWVTLSGNLGASLEVERARQCVSSLKGVRGVFSCLAVHPHAGSRRL